MAWFKPSIRNGVVRTTRATPPPEAETARVPDFATGEARRVVVGEIGLRRTFSALRHRNFRLFFFGQLTSLVGTWMQNTAQGWLVYQLTGSKLLLGVVAAAGSAPMVIFSVWGGWLADHYPKRSVLVVTQSISMMLAFILTAVVWTGVVHPWHIIVIALLAGVVLAFDMPSRQSFMVEMASRDDLMNAISLNSSIVNGARIIGPAVAGAVMAKAGMTWCFFLNGLSFLAVIAGLLMMRLPPHVRPAHAETPWRQVLSGFVYVRGNFRVLVLMCLFAVVGIFGWSYSVLMPAFARDVLHLSERGYGLLLAAGGFGALAAALLLATAGHCLSKRTLVFGGVWIFSAMLILFAFNRNYYLAFPLLAGTGFGMILFFSVSNTLIQTSVSDAMRGRVMGIWALIFGGMVPLGSLEAGALAHIIDIPKTLATGAVVCAIAAAVALAVVVRHHRPEKT